MTVAYIPDAMRQQVTERARGQCEYCRTQQIIVVAMEIDHIIPQSAGGPTTLDNLCLACVICNGAKLDFQTGIDPQTMQEIALFNPRAQIWEAHFEWDNGGLELRGTTSTGRATIARLRINREALVNARRRWVEAGWHPPSQSR